MYKQGDHVILKNGTKGIIAEIFDNKYVLLDSYNERGNYDDISCTIDMIEKKINERVPIHLEDYI